MILPAQINRLLVLANLPDKGACHHHRELEVQIVEALLDGAFDTAGEDIIGEAGFLADGAAETDAVDGFQRFDHCADGLEAAGDVSFGLVEGGNDGFGEVEEEGFALFSAVAFVLEGLLRAS